MDAPNTKSGWLLKWANVVKRYRKRWFILQNGLLSYYGNPMTVGRNCRGTFELKNATIDTRPSQTSFILIEDSGRKHYLKAVSDDDKQSWISVLTSSIKSANLINNNEWDSYSVDSNFIARTRGIESGNHDTGGVASRPFRNRRHQSKKPLTPSPRSSPNLSHDFKANATQTHAPSHPPVFGLLSAQEHAHPGGLAVQEGPDSGEERPCISTCQMSTKGLASTSSSENADDLFATGELIGRFLRQCSSTELPTVTNFLVSVGVLKKRLTEHSHSVYSQIALIESMLDTGDRPCPHSPAQPHLSSAANNAGRSELMTVEQIADDSKKTSNLGCAKSIPELRGVSPFQMMDLKALLADHRINVKDFEKTCTDALKYVVGYLERWHRRLQTEQERCLALERTVEQLARQHRALEQQLSSCYIITSPPSTTTVATAAASSDAYNTVVAGRPGYTLQRGKRSSLKSRHSHGAASSSNDDDDDEFYDVSSCEEDLLIKLRTEPAPREAAFMNTARQALDPVAPLDQRKPGNVDFPSTNSWESFTNPSESSDSVSEEQPCPTAPVNVSVPKPTESQAKPERSTSTNLPVARVRRTTIPYSPKVALNLWSIIKNGIGKDLTKIPLPVNFNEPISFLQRATEDLAYSSLLDQASQCREPASQMALMAAFAVSCYATTAVRTGKPFNPLLGETYELDLTGEDEFGWRLVTEQVSHHPPGSALHCESLRHGWSLWLEFILVSKFRGKYMSVYPKGTVNVLLPDGSRYSWTKVNTLVHNLIVGTLWIDNYGEALVHNHTNGYKCLLRFTPHSYFSRGPQRQVAGNVQNAEGTTEMLISGNWGGYIDCQRAQANGNPAGEPKRLWTAHSPLPDAEQIYNFTAFAVMLNEPEQGVPPTDSRLRPDQRMMEDGLWDQANEEKRRLEAKQRAVRHSWEETQAQPGATNEPLFTPKWFALETDPVTGITSHVYTNKYWEAKEKQDWACCPDIF